MASAPTQYRRNYLSLQSSKKYGVPVAYLIGIEGIETAFGTNVSTSSAGAMGYFQFVKGTANEYSYPYTNEKTEPVYAAQSDAAAHYLSVLYREKKSWAAAIAAYSGGGYTLADVESKWQESQKAYLHERERGKSFLGGAGSVPGEVGKTIENAVKLPGSILEWLNSGGPVKLGLDLLLVLAGLALLVYGVIVAVRPRERAISMPRASVKV